MQKLLLLALYSGGAILLIAISIPLALRKIKPNRWYGFRTPLTLADESIWFAANEDCGKRLAAAGVTMLIGSGAFYFAPRWQLEHYALACLGTAVISLLFAVVGSFIRLNELARESRKQKTEGESSKVADSK